MICFAIFFPLQKINLALLYALTYEYINDLLFSFYIDRGRACLLQNS